MKRRHQGARAYPLTGVTCVTGVTRAGLLGALGLLGLLGAACDGAARVPVPVDPLCVSAADCDDGLYCNGEETCRPGLALADASGCAPGPLPCPGAQACDEADQTCAPDCGAEAADQDGDGVLSLACGGADCDDHDADRFPGNVETCDDGAGGAHDEDCDPSTFGALDADGDGEIADFCCNAGAQGANCGTDCDDGLRSRRAGQVEVCDGVDNDCDGAVDEESAPVLWYLDGDGDGFGAADVSTLSCAPVGGHSLLPTDCDDGDAERHPGQLDVCDLADNNCNDVVDEQPICGVVTLFPAEGTRLTLTTAAGVEVSLEIPAGALPTSAPIALGEQSLRALPSLAAGERFAGVALAVSPFDVRFGAPALLHIPTTLQSPVVLQLRNTFDPTWERVAFTVGAGALTVQLARGGVFVLVDAACDAAPEACNGVDDDCDGAIDEDACVVSVGPPFYPATACPDADASAARVYRVDALELLDAAALARVGTRGHDVDARGASCGHEDLPGGIDVAAADYLAALQALAPSEPWSDWSGALSAALACDPDACASLEVEVSLWPGAGCASLQFSDGATGRALSARFGVVLTAAGAFGGALPALELPIPLRSSVGAEATLRLPGRHVLFTGIEHEEGLADLVIGGVLETPALTNVLRAALSRLTDVETTESVVALAAAHVDVELGPGSCEGLSFAALGSATRQRCSGEESVWDHDADASTACLAWTSCGTGDFVSTAGSDASDQACSPCPPETFTAAANLPLCVAWGVCGPSEFEELPGSPSNDRLCRSEDWSTQVGGGATDNLWAAAAAQDGATVVVGRGDVELSDGGLPGSGRAYVRKYSRGGDVLWTHPFDGASNRVGVAAGSDERVALVFSLLTATDGYDVFLRVYDGDGSVLWTRQIATPANDFASEVSVAPDGSVIVVGSTAGVLTGASNAGDEDAFVRRYDASGNVLWTRQLGTAMKDVATGVDADGARVVVGGTTNGDITGLGAPGGQDAFVIELSLDTGATLSGRPLGTAATDSLAAIRIAPDGRVVAAGTTTGMLGAVTPHGLDGFIRCYAPNWSVLWTGQYGDVTVNGDDQIDALDIAPDGSVVACGATNGALGAPSAGSYDALIVSVSPNGADTAFAQLGSAAQDVCRGVAAHASGRYVVVGDTDGTLATPGNLGGRDGFVVRQAIP
jgi:hypothetical protein